MPNDWPDPRLTQLDPTPFELRHMMIFVSGCAPDASATAIRYINQWRAAGDGSPINDLESAPIRPLDGFIAAAVSS